MQQVGSLRTEVSMAPSAIDCKVVINGLAAFNRAFVELQSAPLAILVRDAAGGTIGGLLAHTSGGWLQIDALWLPEEVRHDGLGSRLVAEAEEEARAHGCIGVHLNTGSFQAPGFYEKLGYAVCGVIENYPRGHKRLTYSKRLGKAVESQRTKGG